MTGTRHHLAPVALATISVALASCSGKTTGPASYAIGATVTGLVYSWPAQRSDAVNGVHPEASIVPCCCTVT